jgi:hypothetical protein
MAGIRVSAQALILDDSPPFSMYEGTTAPYDADQGNVWRLYNSVMTRMTTYTDPTCGSPPCADEQHTPRLSPNRQWIVWADFADGMGVFDGSQCLFYAPANGTGTWPPDLLYSNVLEPEAGLWINHPSWHPNGTKVLFTDSSPDNGYGLGGVIREATFPGGVVTTLWTPDQQSPVQRENGLHPWYSPDGTKIAFLVDIDPGGGGDFDRQGLWVMDADGSNVVGPIDSWHDPGSPSGCCLYSGTQLAWSNDSEWIVYVARSYGGDGNWGVYKIRSDGTNVTLLLTGNPDRESYIGWGAWMPDDTEVIVSTIDTATESGLSVCRLATDGSEALTVVYDGSAGVALNNNSGPRSSQNFSAAYRDGTRVWWVPGSTFGDQAVASVNTDGSNHTVYVLPDTLIASGVGFEWV